MGDDSMFDFKFDQDRFMDRLDDLSDSAEAREKERQQKYKTIIDKGVKACVKAGMYDSEDEARADLIRLLKNRRKLPDDYTYPD